MEDFDVAEPEFPDEIPAGPRLRTRQLHPEKRTSRGIPGHRDQVLAAGTAELQNPAALRVRAFQAEQPAEHGQVPRMGLRKRPAGVVRDRVVVVHGGDGSGP